jgi:chemotaxis protein histidine kinase CheA
MAEEAFFQGSINDAISKSQIERKLFVVSLQDESNASKQLDSVTWTDVQVRTILHNECIAIRLVKGTQQAEQFIQIYNPTQCPLIYLLAQGFPVLIIPGFVGASEFIQKFQGAQQAFSSALTSSLSSSNMGNNNSISAPSVPAATSSTNTSNNNYNAARASNEPKSSSKTSNNNDITRLPAANTKNNNTTNEADLEDEEAAREMILKQYKKAPKNADGADNNETRPLTQEEIDEQVKKYEEKLKEIRAKKAKEKEEEERNKELERIKSAKEMQAAKAKIEEIKRQKEIEKRKKEQEEERLYKEKLRLQIQKDKEERERKANQNVVDSAPSTNKTAYINASANSSNLTSSLSTKSYDRTTLRFRLLNGETLVQEFPGDETLEGVVGFLNNAYNYRVKYSLKTVYPNHIFLPHEYPKTLKQLNLVPNATLILTEGPLSTSGNASLSDSQSSGGSWSPFSVIGSVWRWAWGSGDENNSAASTEYSSQTNTSVNQNAAQNQRNDRVRHRGAGPNVVSLGDVRREGQDDRHKSTWNGNSTQQQ